MEPYKASKMPLEYKIDKEMLRLISDANVKYGEYKTLFLAEVVWMVRFIGQQDRSFWRSAGYFMDNGIRSIAFPSISTGVYKFSGGACSKDCGTYSCQNSAGESGTF